VDQGSNGHLAAEPGLLYKLGSTAFWHCDQDHVYVQDDHSEPLSSLLVRCARISNSSANGRWVPTEGSNFGQLTCEKGFIIK